MTLRYHRHADLRLTALDGEGVVLHMGARRYFTVSETGLVILEAIVTPKSFEELVEAITDSYDVERSHAEASVRSFLDQCLASALIHETTA